MVVIWYGFISLGTENIQSSWTFSQDNAFRKLGIESLFSLKEFIKYLQKTLVYSDRL